MLYARLMLNESQFTLNDNASFTRACVVLCQLSRAKKEPDSILNVLIACVVESTERATAFLIAKQLQQIGGNLESVPSC